MESKDTPRESDHALLRRYADGAREAFDPVVARYVDFVYSAALRQVRDRHLAEDVTQAVFFTLARKAGRIRPDAVLSSWLFSTTRYAAANALKAQARRRYHERRSANVTRDDHTPTNPATSDPWADVAPLLDPALAGLGRRDREAVLLKFVEGRSHREVADAIGVTEEAARKRVARAVERMRAFFQSRGVPVTSIALGAILTTRAVHAAPPALAAAVRDSLAAAARGATAGGGGLAGAVRAIATAAAGPKLLLTGLAALLLVAGGLGYAIPRLNVLMPTARPTPEPAAAPAVSLAADVRPAPAAAAPDREPIEGVVVRADGEPLAGVEVYLATPQNRYAFYAPRQKNKPQVTDTDGKFSFPRPNPLDAKVNPPWVVVARTPDGVAQVTPDDLARSRVVALQPWGRVEGTLYAGDKPLPGGRVFAGFINDPTAKCLINQTTVKTDAAGHFVFPNVSPGTLMLAQETARPWVEHSKWDAVGVRPGQTTRFNVGSVGRPVVGKMVAPPGWERTLKFVQDKTHFTEVAARRNDLPDMTTLPGYSKLSVAEQLRWSEQWWNSPEGIAWQRGANVEPTTLQPDGSFRFDVLKPGRYALTVTLREQAGDSQEAVASGAAEFTVPELPADRQFVREPVDVGSVALTPAPRAIVGAPAPAFRAQTTDGTPVSLADYRGRFLLVQFREVQFREERVQHDHDESDGLKKAHDAFAHDPRVAMLSVHVYTNMERLRRLTAAEALPWPQALGNPGVGGAVPSAYVAGPAMIYLIDPDGLLVSKVLKAGDAETALAKAMLERP